MLTQRERELISDSWRLVDGLGTTVSDLFYRRLFEVAPQFRPLFKDDLEPQKRKLFSMLRFIVRSVDWPDSAWNEQVDADKDFFLIMLALGRRHSDLYHVPAESYAAVCDALLWTLDYGLGKEFTPDTRRAWERVYSLIATTMKLGRLSVDQAVPVPPEGESHA
jgi:hemoglobin-like flavoprotein